MNTTDLFVELIVIGVGAALALVLATCAFFGTAWLSAELLSSITTLVIALAFTYVLGIVVDRIADVIFEKRWKRPILDKYFDDLEHSYTDRRLLYLKGGALSQIIEYSRSRIRICRGWALNSLLLFVSLNLFVWIQLPAQNSRLAFSLLGSLGLLLFAYGNWFAWQQLVHTEYRKVRSQAAFLRGEGNPPSILESDQGDST